MIEELREAYKSGRLVLFVGAGLSLGLGAPSWADLVNHMAEDLGYDPDVFHTYGDYPTLAEYYRVQKRSIGPLRSEMDVRWHRPDIDVSTSRAHELIAKANFDLIYTTNYDRWLEKAFEHYGRPYSKVVGISDLTRVVPGEAQIIKFHGDFDEDSSIVLDESSYFRRMDFEAPLDIKLRSDVMGRSVLFIGYSFNDPNIRYVFYKLATMWSSGGSGDAPPSYLYVPRPNPVQEAVLRQRNIFTLSPSGDDAAVGLVELLEAVTGT